MSSALSSFRTESTESGGSVESPFASMPPGLMSLPPAASADDGEPPTPSAPFCDVLRAEWDVQGPPQIEIMNIVSGILEGLTVWSHVPADLRMLPCRSLYYGDGQ